MDTAVRYEHNMLTSEDYHYFNEGTHYSCHEKLGSHPMTVDGVHGVHFAVWAPNAYRVYVTGGFNHWNKESHPLQPSGSGIWHGFIPNIGKGEHYKYFIVSNTYGYSVEKADPYACFFEMPPKTASIVWDLDYEWSDSDWMATRRERNAHDAPISIYEAHLGSWMHDENGHSYSYRELAPRLAEHLLSCGFTHVEFLPVMEHPYYGSWGYQCLGFFAPTSRFGTPQDFMYLVDYLHQKGIGVVLDWVPSHFPTDNFGLSFFDGTHLYEHADPREGFHPDWGSYIFNYGRHEVQNFLISSALFWLEKYHIDGLRVDAVASMLYRDYSRKEGEWIPNKYGGRENIEAIEFLRKMNTAIYGRFPDVQTFAEESTSWPMVSKPTEMGGLGFGFKWDMGWMHDTLVYITKEPIHRKYHHNQLTFRMIYAFAENFIMPLSHDEVVHGKGSMLNKMPGDIWQKFANLRVLYGNMWGQAGKKLLFMGAEVGQWNEWAVDHTVEWHLLEHESHQGLMRWIMDLNRTYRAERALYELDTSHEGFEWIDCNDRDASTLTFARWSRGHDECVLVALNMTPVPREGFRIGVPREGHWRELLNSDARDYWGGGMGNAGGTHTEPVGHHGRPQSIVVTLPPLSAVYFKNGG